MSPQNVIDRYRSSPAPPPPSLFLPPTLNWQHAAAVLTPTVYSNPHALSYCVKPSEFKSFFRSCTQFLSQLQFHNYRYQCLLPWVGGGVSLYAHVYSCIFVCVHTRGGKKSTPSVIPQAVHLVFLILGLSIRLICFCLHLPSSEITVCDFTPCFFLIEPGDQS